MRLDEKKRYLPYAILLCLLLVQLTISVSSAEEPEWGKGASYSRLEPGEFMRSWLVLGAIPVSQEQKNDEANQKKAFARDFLVGQGEATGNHPIDGTDYKWKLIKSDSDIVDLTKILGKKEFVIAYAWAEIQSPETRRVFLGIGSDDSVKLWLNGKLVHEKWAGRPVEIDNDIVAVTLAKGQNTVLLKIQNGIQDWGFACRQVDSQTLVDKLILAVRRVDMKTLEELLSQGVDVNAKDQSGLTALNAARMNGRTDIAEFLLKKGADPNIKVPPPDKLADSMFERATQGESPAIVVLAAQNGKILYRKAFGFANLEKHIPATPETKFRIGSVTKQFTAAAILKLQEDGLLSVNDKLSKFIPDYPRGDEVTLHHLLTHTSGIHSYTADPDFFLNLGKKVEPEDIIKLFKGKEFNFNPGEKWLYCNSGYYLLGYIVQKVSGKTLGEYLKEQFFDPLGMKNTGIYGSGLDLENEAEGYSYKSGKVEKATKWDMSQAGGAGAIYSTVDDLFTWNEAVFSGKALKEASLKAAFTPVKLNDGTIANAMGAKYGYGWMISETRGLKEIMHSGGFNGFNAYLARYPEQSFTIVALVNCLPTPPPKGGSIPLLAAIGAEALANCYLWDRMENVPVMKSNPSVDTSLYDDYVGKYNYGPYAGYLTVTREGKHLYAQLSRQPRYEIFPRAKDQFFWKVVDAQITFVRDKSGKVTHVIHKQGGNEFEAPKVEEKEPVKVDPAILDDYVGQYDFVRAVLTITREDDHLYAQMTGQPKFELFPSSETEFHWNIVDAQITFVKDNEGKVIKAIYKQGEVKMEVKKIK